MRVAIVVSGSRGDVQPMLAVALRLRKAGHQVLFGSSPDNAAWARNLGVEFQAVGEPLRDNRSLSGWTFTDFDPFIRRQIVAQISDLPPLVRDVDILVASGLAFGAGAVAERLGIRYRYVSFVPASFLGTTRDGAATRFIRDVANRYADFRYGAALDRGRARLGLPRVRGVMRQLMGSDPIAATDRLLTVLPDGAQLRVAQTAYPVLEPDRDLSPELVRFLEAGPPPIYAGFGSMPVGHRARVVELLVAAARRAGQRVVISRGWARLSGAARDRSSLFVDDEPHASLFPRVRVVIHHGGAGTIATAARAGVPQVVLAQAADQFLWREAIDRLGLGPRAPLLRLASERSLVNAIARAIDDEAFRRRAAEMSARLANAPDGVAMTVEEITRRVRGVP